MKGKVERETKEYQQLPSVAFDKSTHSRRHWSRKQHLESTELFLYFAFDGAIVGSGHTGREKSWSIVCELLLHPDYDLIHTRGNCVSSLRHHQWGSLNHWAFFLSL